MDPQVTHDHDEPPLASAEAFYAAGHLLYSQRRFEDAITVFLAVIRLAPTDERGWLALGACHEALDRHDVALELYDEARRLREHLAARGNGS
jgi:tetratricopeptide (TPR) repeat protein